MTLYGIYLCLLGCIIDFKGAFFHRLRVNKVRVVGSIGAEADTTQMVVSIDFVYDSHAV